MDYDIEKDEYMKDWKEVRLGDVVEDFIDNRGKNPPYYTEIGIPVIDNFLIKGDKNIDLTAVKRYIDENLYNEFIRKKIVKNDILITLVGNGYGNVALAPKERCIIIQNTVGLRCKNDNNVYLFYYLRLRLDEIRAMNRGSAQPSVKTTDLKNLIITLPPLPTQQKIAQILSSLDDKIELNNAINKNLEEIAQTLFKQWFVDFEFPASLASPLFQGGDREGDGYKSSGGEMVESELGEIPKGWRVDNLEGIASYLNGLAMQKFPPENENDCLPVIKIKELRTGITNDSDKASINIDKKYIINDGDILFSWSGSLEVVIWTGGTGGLNQHLFKVTSEIFEKWFYYLWTKYHLEKFRHIAESKATTMGHIKREDLKKSLVVIPNELELDKMNNIFNPVLSKIIKNSIETQTLTKLRDELLPKLMSGEVRV